MNPRRGMVQQGGRYAAREAGHQDKVCLLRRHMGRDVVVPQVVNGKHGYLPCPGECPGTWSQMSCQQWQRRW